MTCKYKNGNLVFSDDVNISDGVYVLYGMGNSLFVCTEAQFDKLAEDIKKLIATDDKAGRMYARCVLSSAEKVSVKNGRLPLSGYFKDRITVLPMKVEVTPDHIKIFPDEND